MEWRPLESKMFLSTTYDAEGSILYLRFQSGDVYRYFEFPENQYQDFLNAESHGKYFLANIRDQFKYERLAKLRVA
jgi:hypothetical protein